MSTNDSLRISAAARAGLPTAPYPGGFMRSWSGGRRRILGDGQHVNTYHVMSRTAGGEMLFGAVEKEALVRIMRRLERFAGVEVLTYAVMGNHFHLLVRVPERQQFLARFEGEGGEERLLGHLGLLYSKAWIDALYRELGDLRKRGMEAEADSLLERIKVRLCNLSSFVKELKERYSRWFNKHHGRKGTLWMERYKSVLVEDGDALRTMACYIDLNPLRAGLADDPKDYRWSGYAEAVAGSKRARRGLCRVMERPLDSWNEPPVNKHKGSLTAGEWYRCWLFDDAMEKPGRKGFQGEKVREEKDKDGAIARAVLLRCRVRYFSDGLAIGSRDFIEEAFRRQRKDFSPKRSSGARPIREAPGCGLFSLRALRVRAVE